MPPKKKIRCCTCDRVFSASGYHNHFRHNKNFACQLARDAACGLLGEDDNNKRIGDGVSPEKIDKVNAAANMFLDMVEQADAKTSLGLVGGIAPAEDCDSMHDSRSKESYSSEEDALVNLGDGNPPNEIAIQLEVESSLLESFDAYIQEAQKDFLPLTAEDIAGINLLHIMYKKRAPLNSYEEISGWRKEFSNEPEHEKEAYVPRKTLFKKLLNRYNLRKNLPFKTRVTLPYSGANINLVLHDFKAQLTSLLSDPRIGDDDYLFFDDNPFVAPPDNLNYMKDINTGRAFVETWHAKIQAGSNQVLLPIIWYIDGAVTGQYDHLPLTALQFTLGIFKKETRDKPYAWRSVGYVPKFGREDTKGEELYAQSGHMDSGLQYQNDLLAEDVNDSSFDDYSLLSDSMSNSDKESENENFAPELDDWLPPVFQNLPKANSNTRGKLQDFHVILNAILEGSGYKSFQDHGFEWKLHHKKEVKSVLFVIFSLMIKGDTQEHDKHCGKFNSRSGNVKCLCRYCTCPTEKSDDPTAKYRLKSPVMIQNAIRRQEWGKLNGWSQHIIKNAWHDISFGLHNNNGVHAACPSEMLHALLLGLFMYARDTFFAQCGTDSSASKTVNALASKYGKFLQHQSDRDKARTNFNKGIHKGKLMAREYSGLLLVLLVVLRSTKGRQALMTQRGAKEFFGEEEQIHDWIMLLETLIQWEVWMRQDTIKKHELGRARNKLKYMMGLFKKIVQRQKGMGMRLTKFHVILHLIDDILNFGVPTVVDTGANEMAHKGAKTAARQTQKNKHEFEFQTANRCIEMLAVQYGMLEKQHDITPWKYHWEDSSCRDSDLDSDSDSSCRDEDSSSDDGDTDSEQQVNVSNTGTVFVLAFDESTKQYTYKTHKSRSEHVQKNTWWDPQLAEFLGENILAAIGCDRIFGFSEHKRNSQIFRAHPNFRGELWSDWAMINWGPAWGIQPAHIWTFLDLQELPDETHFEIAGTGTSIDGPGVYAVVESGYTSTDLDEISKSTLLIPIRKETYNLEPLQRKFYVVSVDSFHAPACVIPDIGGEPNAFFRLLPKQEWLSTFINWLNAPQEKLEDLETTSEEDEDLEDESEESSTAEDEENSNESDSE